MAEPNKTTVTIAASDETKNAIQNIVRAFRGLESEGRKVTSGLQGAFQTVAAGTATFYKKLTDVRTMLTMVAGSLAVREFVDIFMGYNKTLETSKLGIAAIITSMAKVTDSQGRTLEGGEKFAASQQLAVQAQQELLKIGMTTSATYQELVEVYQGILAPALSAKMTFAETLDITGLLTNAVKAIGLPINQIKQEARDLIQGGIQPASSSLATALGISDAMVKKWREQGTVYEELKSRLKGFVYASNEFGGTWEGIWSNFKDVSQRALGEGFFGLFEIIKSGMNNLTNALVNITRDSAGNIQSIEIKPEVQDAILKIQEVIYKGWIILKSIIESVWNVLSSFSGPLYLIAGVIGKIVEGWGLIFTMLPPVTERVKYLLQSVWEMVKAIYHFGEVLWKIASLDFTGAKEAFGKAQASWGKAGQLGSAAISPGLGTEMEARLNEFYKNWNKPIKPLFGKFTIIGAEGGGDHKRGR